MMLQLNNGYTRTDYHATLTLEWQAILLLSKNCNLKLRKLDLVRIIVALPPQIEPEKFLVVNPKGGQG